MNYLSLLGLREKSIFKPHDIKYQLCLTKNKKIIYSDSNMSKHGLGTWSQVISNDMLYCGKGYMNFDSHKKESHESMSLQNA
jgi:hypothetical protein